MQISRSENGHDVRVGDRVRNRGERWIVSAVEPGHDCIIVTVTGADIANRGSERRLLLPFDRLEPIPVRRRLRLVGRHRWRRECRTLIANHGSAPILRTALTARMQLMPHQLEPVLAVVRGLGSRVLIADAVGLGKTVQAGLILAELRARHAASRVLILTPAGVRDQWIAELQERFGLQARLFDAVGVRQRQRSLPIGISPWTTEPIVAASTDYVKRPEILRAVADVRWDLVIVDEAHGVVAPSDRHGAVSTLCRTAACVVLLTATPHSGDQRAFESLCGIGAQGDRLLIFRRSRADVGVRDTRRIHQLVVHPTAAERRLHETLRAFREAIDRENSADEQVTLVLAMLRKRALSSAASLARSVERRLALLQSDLPFRIVQLALPLSADGELNDDDSGPEWRTPVLRNPSEERAWLTRLAGEARAASMNESKLRALASLLSRVPEPIIVFTEYRDTLAHVRQQVAPRAVLLHGGLTQSERRRALAEFSKGGHILLATDAASEGLNLHETSRIVVNLELPWNPMRLEQRIGRVDRIGQRRRVHAFHLLAGDSDEMALRERLSARLSTAHTAIGAANPLAGHGSSRSRKAAEPPRRESAADYGAQAEASRLKWMRTIIDAPGTLHEFESGPLMTDARSTMRATLNDRVLVLLQSTAAAWNGHVLGLRLTPVVWNTHRPALTLEMLDRLAAQVADFGLPQWREETAMVHRAFWDCRLERLIAIGRSHDARSASLQPGLFDLRSVRRYQQHAQTRHDARAQLELDIDMIRRWREVAFAPTIAVLVLTP